MLFRLKNVEATNQHLVNQIFKDQFSTTIKVYIDYMITKFVRATNHAAYCIETFAS